MKRALLRRSQVYLRNYERGVEGAIAAGVSRIYHFGSDHELWARIGLARTLLLRGLPDQAAQFALRSIEFARVQECRELWSS
jgi:hypothetical protein